MYTYCIINYFVLIPSNKKNECDKMLEVFNDKAEITWIFVFLNFDKIL